MSNHENWVPSKSGVEEALAALYLRLNGYFTSGLIVHASRAERGSNRTEIDLLDYSPFWNLAQSLFEVLPRGQEDWKLTSVLLGERETLPREARRAAPPTQGSLFDE